MRASTLPARKPLSSVFRARAPVRRVSASPSVVKASAQELATNAALFFSPGMGIAAYCMYLGQGNLKNGFSKFLTQVSQGYFQPNLGGENIPAVDADVKVLDSELPLFTFLFQWFKDLGGVYKLAFGPKAFLVVSDPEITRYILKENTFNYDKGVLAEILEPIMGKGLIPADFETWKPRRRAIVPAFHKAYLNAMIKMFAQCTLNSADKLTEMTAGGKKAEIDMETEFLNIALDIIGLGVFNYDFGSIRNESPVIKSVYGVLREAEHRSTFYIPYWNIPGADIVVPRQRKFREDLKVINGCLDELIERAKSDRVEEDFEALQNRDYDKLKDPSLLRFLVDSRGEDITNKQLRDDLMTMLVAGHETTAAVLTWALFSLAQDAEVERKLLEEVDRVLGDEVPTLDHIARMPYLRMCLSESLRMYPQPPILIRRSMSDDTLPSGLTGDPAGYPISKGADIFISVYNLHRSPFLWREPDSYRPDRFTEEHLKPEYAGKWAGYRPDAGGSGMSSLYPNEVASDFAFIPFGGGARKCVGDQFAMFEATVALAILMRRFTFRLKGDPKDVGMATGATIHTANGLHMTVVRRVVAPQGQSKEAERVAA